VYRLPSTVKDTQDGRFKELRGFKVKKAILLLSITVASGLLMVSIYNTLVDAKSWGSDIPTSIQAARDYYKHVDPRRLYAVMGPINQLLSLLTIIVFWRYGSLRWYFIASFLLYAAIVLLTFVYFVPRDLMLFTWPIQDHLEEIRAAAAQWSHMNWLRSLLGLAGVLSSFKGLDTYYKIQAASS
jgi:hypothetical protein